MFEGVSCVWVGSVVGMVGADINAAPRLPVGPVLAGFLPERGIGGKAEGQEDGGAQVLAAGVDVVLRHVDLAAAEADGEPAVLVKGVGGFHLAFHDGGQGATHLLRGDFRGQFVQQSRLGKSLECPETVGDGAADDGVGAFRRDLAFLDGGIAGEALVLGVEEVGALHLVLVHDAEDVCEHGVDDEAVVVVVVDFDSVAIDAVSVVPLVAEFDDAVHEALGVAFSGEFLKPGFDHGGEEEPVALPRCDLARLFHGLDEVVACFLVEIAEELLRGPEDALDEEGGVHQRLGWLVENHVVRRFRIDGVGDGFERQVDVLLAKLAFGGVVGAELQPWGDAADEASEGFQMSEGGSRLVAGDNGHVLAKRVVGKVLQDGVRDFCQALHPVGAFLRAVGVWVSGVEYPHAQEGRGGEDEARKDFHGQGWCV